MNLTNVKIYLKKKCIVVNKMPFLLNDQDAYKVINQDGEYMTVTKKFLLQNYESMPFFLKNED